VRLRRGVADPWLVVTLHWQCASPLAPHRW
jgi:hypothetical protein